jgi:hypothetical protein
MFKGFDFIFDISGVWNSSIEFKMGLQFFFPSGFTLPFCNRLVLGIVHKGSALESVPVGSSKNPALIRPSEVRPGLF